MPVAPATRTARLFERFENVRALQHPDYRRFWLGFVVSMSGNWMQIHARAFLVFVITGSSAALGTIYLASYAPQLIFALFGGALADRFDRRHLVIMSNIVQALFAALFGVMAITDTATLWNFAALSFVVGVFQTVMGPATMAAIPALVPKRDLASAISLHSAATSVTRVSGPLMAAAIIGAGGGGAIGAGWAFFVNAVTFGATLYAWLRTPVQITGQVEKKTFGAVVEGLRLIRRTPTIATPILMLAVLSAIGLVYQPLAVAYAVDVLADGDSALGNTYYSWLQAAIGIGAAVGVLALVGPAKRRPALVTIGTGLLFSVMLAGLGVAELIWVALPVGLLLGGFHFANSALLQTIVQHEAPEAYRGRIMAVFMAAFVGLFPFTSQGLGWLADVTSISFTLVASGAACFAFSLWIWTRRHHFRIELHEEEPDLHLEGQPAAEGPAVAAASDLVVEAAPVLAATADDEVTVWGPSHALGVALDQELEVIVDADDDPTGRGEDTDRGAVAASGAGR